MVGVHSALVVSNNSRATFISLCSWRSSLVTLSGLTLGGSGAGRQRKCPLSLGICSQVGWCNWGVVWVRLGVSPGVATRGVCVKVAVRAGMADLSPFAWGNLLFLLLRVGSLGPSMVAPSWVTMPGDRGGCCSGDSLQLLQGPLEKLVCGHGKVTGGFIVSAGECVGTSVVVGAWMAVITPSGCTWLRSTSRNHGSWKGSLEASMSQRSSSVKVNCRSSSPNLSPLDTLPSPHAATACPLATDAASCRHWCWVHHLSWCWCAPDLIEVYEPWHHSVTWRHMASPCLHPPVAHICGLPLAELGSRLGADVPTPQWGQTPFHTQQWYWALLIKTPYPHLGDGD